MRSGAALKVRDISLRFGGLIALSGVSFDVPPGEAVGLLGPNGAGKSSLIAVIAGSQRATGGRVYLDDRPIERLGPDARARAGVRRTFQITQPFASMTVAENLMVGGVAGSGSLTTLKARAREFAAQVGLGDKFDAVAKTLSTGQRKRLELARALMGAPRLLLIDEVMGGVDQASGHALLELVLSIKREGVSLLVVEHNIRALRTIVDRLVFLDRGQVIVSGTPADVIADSRVADLYMGGGRAQN